VTRPTAGSAAVAASEQTTAPGIGILLLFFALPSALLTAAFSIASQTGWRDERGAALGGAVFAGIFTLWLGSAGLALLRRRPRGSLRVPGALALLATVVGVAVLVPTAMGNPRTSEMVEFAQLCLPLTLTSVLAGAGHLTLAGGGDGPARILHVMAPLGALISLATFVMMVMRVR
jgi:uncharacterized membrane protein (DUF441 family)